MQSKRFHQARALALAAALVGWNGLASPRVPPRWHPVPHAVLGAALVALTRAPLGLRRPALPAGLRLGSAAAAGVITAVAAATAVPAVRQAMAARPPTGPAARWLLLGIPVGTVWSEEAAFRGALGTLGDDAFGPVGGQVLQAVAFGLSHFGVATQSISSETPAPPPARPLVLGTMLVTGVAGWAFDRLYRRTGSLAASMLAHLAINEAGAVAVLAVQRWAARPR